MILMYSSTAAPAHMKRMYHLSSHLLAKNLKMTQRILFTSGCVAVRAHQVRREVEIMG